MNPAFCSHSPVRDLGLEDSHSRSFALFCVQGSVDPSLQQFLCLEKHKAVNMSHTETSKPASWPQGIEFLRVSKISKNLSPEAMHALNDKPTAAPSVVVSSGPSLNVRIRPISDVNHPAKGQYGLFASQRLAPDTLILQYLGFVHTEDEADSSSSYDLSLDREVGVGIDATRMGNEARFINDYRGIAPSANAEFRDVWIDTGSGRMEKRMAVYVLSAGKSGKRAKGIAKGEEIMVSYGKGFWNDR